MELIESFNNFDNFISYFSSSNKQELALEFILRFVLLLLLDSIVVFCRCNNRIRATVKILCSNCWSIWRNIRFYVTIRIEIEERRILIRKSYLKSKNWSGILFVIVNLNTVLICFFHYSFHFIISLSWILIEF